jgi:hypothetical protein
MERAKNRVQQQEETDSHRRCTQIGGGKNDRKGQRGVRSGARGAGTGKTLQQTQMSYIFRTVGRELKSGNEDAAWED